jgi:threonine/homoserine/homoserine lactone efflux protein
MYGIPDYGAFVASFLFLLFLPGPGNLALITSTTQGGIRGGLASILGLLLGDQVLMWLTVVGVAALLQSNPEFFKVLQWLGAAYLACLGFKMLLAKSGDGASIKMTPGRYFRETTLITLLNPKAMMFYFAFFPQFIHPEQHQGMLTFFVMALTIAFFGFLYCLGVVYVTHTMAQRLRTQARTAMLLQKMAGLMLVGFGLKLALGK